MSYQGFSKLRAILAKKGLKNPDAAAAKIGMEKYGKAKFLKAAHAGKSLKGATPKK